MKHRIYDTIKYNTYIKVNAGLDYINNIWGYGCPLGMEPITFNEMQYDRNQLYNCKKYKVVGVCIEDYLYDSGEVYEKFLKSRDRLWRKQQEY